MTRAEMRTAFLTLDAKTANMMLPVDMAMIHMAVSLFQSRRAIAVKQNRVIYWDMESIFLLAHSMTWLLDARSSGKERDMSEFKTTRAAEYLKDLDAYWTKVETTNAHVLMAGIPCAFDYVETKDLL